MADRTVLHWQASDPNGIWFETELSFSDRQVALSPSSDPVSLQLCLLLNTCIQLNPKFLSQTGIYTVDTHLEFHRSWGWGSSSSLLSNVAAWADLDPMEVNRIVHPVSSGYDVAAARSEHPFIYRVGTNDILIEPVTLTYPFKDHLAFIFSGKKQLSAESISEFRHRPHPDKDIILKISHLTQSIATTSDLQQFIGLLEEHEEETAKLTRFSPIQSTHFTDFPGIVKSLGAWGGDFFLAASPLPIQDIKDYFHDKGLITIFSWNEIIA